MTSAYTYVPGRYYEVHFHGQVQLADGSLTADHGGNPTSWCVYVREYESADADTWETLEDEDFVVLEQADFRATMLAAKYGNCGIDEF